MSDLISRQDVIGVIDNAERIYVNNLPTMIYKHSLEQAIIAIPAQPEPAIPLRWIETEIEWLKSLDNAFATSRAEHISAIVNVWKGEQNG